MQRCPLQGATDQSAGYPTEDKKVITMVSRGGSKQDAPTHQVADSGAYWVRVQELRPPYGHSSFKESGQAKRPDPKGASRADSRQSRLAPSLTLTSQCGLRR